MEARHDQKDERLPIGDAARILGVTAETLRRWEARGKVTAHRTPGGQRRYDRAEIGRLLNRANRTAA